MLPKCEWVMGKLPVKGRDCRKHGDRLPAGARAMLNHCRRCRVLLQIRSAFWLLRANCAFAGCCQIPAASPVGFSASLAALGAVQGAVRRRCSGACHRCCCMAVSCAVWKWPAAWPCLVPVQAAGRRHHSPCTQPPLLVAGAPFFYCRPRFCCVPRRPCCFSDCC